MKRRSRTLKASKARTPQRLLRRERKLSRLGFTSIAGVDEAGRGPLAGPVVAGAVILKDRNFRQRVDDSKKLTPAGRRRAYDEIVKKAVVGIGVVDEAAIDEINIYQATIRAMQEALKNLSASPDYIIVDGRVKLSSDCPVEAVIKGDSKSLSIAAASIVAKVTRDAIMCKYHELYPQYGFAAHKGYPTKLHREKLKLHGPSPIHRFSFTPVKESIA